MDGYKKNERQKGSGCSIDVSSNIELAIEDINHEGQGIGHFQGLTVFVPGTIPGDLVRVKIIRKMSRYAIGEIELLLRNSPARIKRKCPVADSCGGCTLQAMAYKEQLKYKQDIVSNALLRIGKVQNLEDKLLPIKGMDNPWRYRAKVQLPVSGSWQDPQIGFYASRSHEVIDTNYCPVQPEVCDVIREVIREYIREWQIEPYDENTQSGLLRHIVIRTGFATGDIMVVLVINGKTLPGLDELINKLETNIKQTNRLGFSSFKLRSFYLCSNQKKTNLILSENVQLVYGQPQIEEKINGIRYLISPLAFFQVNPIQAEVLFRTVISMAKLGDDAKIIDLYCGTGSITLQLAKIGHKVIGIESNASAVDDAIINAQINKIKNTEFMTGRAEDLLPDYINSVSPGLVVLDPPRKGCDSKLIATLIENHPESIIYVSCNPATLARDIALLGEGGYSVRKIQPVDMFPWTGHVETVVLMSRTEAGKD